MSKLPPVSRITMGVFNNRPVNERSSVMKIKSMAMAELMIASRFILEVKTMGFLSFSGLNLDVELNQKIVKRPMTRVAAVIVILSDIKTRSEKITRISKKCSGITTLE